MAPPAPTRPVAAALEGPAPAAPPARGNLRQPEHQAGVLRGCGALDAWLAGGYDARRLPRRAPRAAESPVERVERWWPRRTSGLVSPANRARPGNERPGCWQATGGAPSAAAKRARSWRRTWPRLSPRSRRRVRRGRPEARSVRRGDRGAAVQGGDAAQRGERLAVGRRRRGGPRRRGAGDGPPPEDEPGRARCGRGPSSAWPSGDPVRVNRLRPSPLPPCRRGDTFRTSRSLGRRSGGWGRAARTRLPRGSGGAGDAPSS